MEMVPDDPNFDPCLLLSVGISWYPFVHEAGLDLRCSVRVQVLCELYEGKHLQEYESH